jgi:hypothetical protein
MDLPEEELKRPLVTAAEPRDPLSNEGYSPSRSPKGHGRGRSPKRAVMKAVEPPRMGGGPTGNHYVAMRGIGGDNGEEEEKEDSKMKQQLPYAAPNVHPYAVPQYEPSAYGGGGNGWGNGPQENGSDQSRIPTIDIVFSGMYTLAAVLTIFQGFGMLIRFSLPSGL